MPVQGAERRSSNRGWPSAANAAVA